MGEKINVWGARVHNLKNIDVEIPRDSLTVITGLSGSGKSSLAFDTIYAEGQRRYIDTFSAYARNFLGGMERPDVDNITGLSPVISIEQKTTNKNPRSTVGTTTEIYDYLRLLFARAGTAYSYATGEKQTQIVVYLGRSAHGRAWIAVGCLLLNGDDGAESGDVVNIGTFQSAEKVACVCRESVDVAALSLCIYGVEGKRRLARTAQSGDDGERTARYFHVDVFKIVDACAPDIYLAFF